MKKIFTIVILALSINAFAQIPTDSLKAWYPFNGNANDESGNGNNGTVHGAILTTDRFGNVNSAYSFDGIDDYILVADTNSLDFGTNSFSFSFWLKYPSQIGGYDDYSSILTKADASYPYTGLTFFVEQPTNGKVSFRTGAINTLNSKSSNLNNDTWTHFVGIRNGNILKLYINGIIDTTITTATIDNISNNLNLYIGGHPTDMLAQKLNGILDDIRIYNRALSEQEIVALYNENICHQTIYDTVITNVYDTTYVTITDTNYVTINDTIYISVTDTLIIDAVLTGINPPNNINTIKVYPNPSNTHIYINTGDYASMNGYTIRIDNSLGQTVYITPVNQQQYYVDLSSWTGNGTYFVYIIDNLSNTIDVRKIIIQ